MLYKKYHLYDEGVEIMIPSDIKPAESFLSSQNSWLSKDKKTVIHISRGGADLTEENLNNQLNEYYKGFHRDVCHFKCRHIIRRTINRRVFGEIQYTSCVTGYHFYNVFLLGGYQGRELVITIQCMENQWAPNEHIFENIIDSIRILKRQQDDMEDTRHAG
ncbi:MAG TPA: hypothetical protein DCZ91_24815 [Lachnospiraceae bacterium]|nr:hypothetical protein [Lachnospiraceae bacterium]